MPNPSRLEFRTRHFSDLQTIRFAPVPAAMMLAIAAHRMPHLGRGAAWAMLIGFWDLIAGVYRWSTLAIRRRYGSVRQSGSEAMRMRRHPILAGLNIVAATMLIFNFFAPHSYYWALYSARIVLIVMLQTILDFTNLASRRFAWTIGLVVLFTGGPFLVGIDGAAISLTGAVWLSLSVFDFLLLRRIFAETVAAPPVADTEAVLRRG